MSTIILAGIRCEICQCITCGIPFTVPDIVINKHREVGGYHSCPNGHSQGWDKDGCEVADLRRERDRLKQQIAAKDDDIAWQKQQRKDAERLAAAARGQVTKLKKRAAAGVCPCCNRQFSNMHRHMQTKHPEFKGTPDLKVVGQS